MSPEATLRCRLFVPKEYARIAYMWHNMLFPSDSSQRPDFVSVYVPDWPERLIFCDVNQGYTYILGSDYPGEAKKSMLRQAMYWIKRQGGLGLHAGSKILRVTGLDGKLRGRRVPPLRSLGHGQATLTLHDHGLASPRGRSSSRTTSCSSRATAAPSERRTASTSRPRASNRPRPSSGAPRRIRPPLREHQGRPGDGKVDFLDTSLTSNGRGVVLRRYIKGTGDGIDLPKANKIVFITRRNDVVPSARPLRAGGGLLHARRVDRDLRRRPDEGRAGQAGGRDESLHRRSGVRGGQPTPRDPAREPGHAGLHPEHRLDRREGRLRRREDHDQGLDGDHEADRQGGHPLGEGPRLGLRGAGDVPGVDLGPYDPAATTPRPSTAPS